MQYRSYVSVMIFYMPGGFKELNYTEFVVKKLHMHFPAWIFYHFKLDPMQSCANSNHNTATNKIGHLTHYGTNENIGRSRVSCNAASFWNKWFKWPIYAKGTIRSYQVLHVKSICNPMSGSQDICQTFSPKISLILKGGNDLLTKKCTSMQCNVIFACEDTFMHCNVLHRFVSMYLWDLTSLATRRYWSRTFNTYTALVNSH